MEVFSCFFDSIFHIRPSGLRIKLR